MPRATQSRIPWHSKRQDPYPVRDRPGPRRVRVGPTMFVPRWIPPLLAHDGREAKDVANSAWWGQFNDPVLDNLIRSALQENLDLQIASARVDEFAGRYGFVRADLFPRSGPTRRPAASGPPRRRGTLSPRSSTPRSITTRPPSTPAGAGHLGPHPSRHRSRRAELVASEEGRRAVILSLVAPSPVPTSTSATSTGSWRSRRRRRRPR